MQEFNRSVITDDGLAQVDSFYLASWRMSLLSLGQLRSVVIYHVHKTFDVCITDHGEWISSCCAPIRAAAISLSSSFSEA